jgi:hypothetical protein
VNERTSDDWEADWAWLRPATLKVYEMFALLVQEKQRERANLPVFWTHLLEDDDDGI